MEGVTLQILLADDEAATRDFVQKALQGAGHTVVTAENGEEAFAKLTADVASINVLVSDVSMPGMDGLSLAQQARALSPSLAIVLISALDTELERAKTLTGPRIKVLSKPFSLEQIRQAVTEVAS